MIAGEAKPQLLLQDNWDNWDNWGIIGDMQGCFQEPTTYLTNTIFRIPNLPCMSPIFPHPAKIAKSVFHAAQERFGGLAGDRLAIPLAAVIEANTILCVPNLPLGVLPMSTSLILDNQIRILVLGDVNLDTLFVPVAPESKRSRDEGMTWKSEGNFWHYRRKGGAWLLRDIIEAGVTFNANGKTINCKPKVDTYQPKDPLVAATLENLNAYLDQPYLNSSVILGLFPKTAKAGPDDQVYRIKTFLGWIHSDKEPYSPAQQVLYQKAVTDCLLPFAEEKNERDILILHDKNSYFRKLEPRLLKKAVQNQLGDKTWLVWHMYSPLASGNLWGEFEGNTSWLDRTVAVVKAECLRQEGVNLPDQLSLEQESQNFLESIETVDSLKRLTTMRHLIVHFHRQGVLHYDREAGLRNSCYYCPRILNDPASPKLGTMLGYTSNLVAAVVRGITWCIMNKQSDITSGVIDGVKQGVVLDYFHYHNGYGDKSSLDKRVLPTPYGALFEELCKAADANWRKNWEIYHLGALELPKKPGGLKHGHLREWSRIQSFLESKAKTIPTQQQSPPELIGQDIVRRGLSIVADEESEVPAEKSTPGTPPHTITCPYEIHGKIMTAYRHEIDGFASIRRIMEKYLSMEDWKHPLSIAVFGQPGSGKSFTIRQILENVDPDIAKRPLEYNVAQFSGVKDLETVFHQAQDRALADEVPLVVFDEFDTENLKWLQYFLAPMQDGKFKSGEGIYRIGRAIFVFAGGICHTWDQFINYKKGKEDFKDAKGFDFISRLRGHLDIAGINCADNAKLKAASQKKKGLTSSIAEEDGDSQNNIVDPVLIFRRAVLLRSLLENHLKAIIDKNTHEAQIDRGVVRAFLNIPTYAHGVRSMQAIIEMARVSPRGRFLKSSLPTPDQLKMHVNAGEFLNLVNNYPPLGTMK